MENKLPFHFCRLFITFGLLLPLTITAQESFRGKVTIKSFDLLNSENLSVIGRLYRGKNPSQNYDTIYSVYHICNDTIISQSYGVDGPVRSGSMQYGGFSFIPTKSGGFPYYMQIPINKNQNYTGGASPDDWKKHARPRRRSGVHYDYSLANPQNHAIKLFASVNPGKVYTKQWRLGGKFGNALHPFGTIDTLIFHDGITDVCRVYTYTINQDYNCQEFIQEIPIKEMGEEADELFAQLEVKSNSQIIDKTERKPFLLSEGQNLDATGSTTIEQFKGKYIYLDVWASWCVPCRAETPYLQDLQAKYPADKLAILSISLDKAKDERKWEKAIESLHMDWDNWIIYDGFKSTFAQQYEIIAVPRYMIIDDQGTIVNPDAPRPSDPAVMDLLNQLLSTSDNE